MHVQKTIEEEEKGEREKGEGTKTVGNHAITELDAIRFLRILRRDLVNTSELSGDLSDKYTRNRAKEESEILAKFIAIFEQRSSTPTEDLREEIKDLKYEQAKDRQRIAELELYINSKNNGRRDFDLLTVKLLKEVENRKKGMNYKDIMNFFHLKSPNEAYRLMDKTQTKFPHETKIIHKKRVTRITKIGNRL